MEGRHHRALEDTTCQDTEVRGRSVIVETTPSHSCVQDSTLGIVNLPLAVRTPA